MTTLGAARAGASAGVLRGDVVTGRPRVLAELPGLERLARELQAPVPARTAWLRAQLDALPRARPWAVRALRSERGLAGAVVLLDGELGPLVAGGGGGHRGAVLAADEDAARALGRALLTELDRRGVLPAPATLRDDAVTAAFAAAAGAEATPAAPIPALVPDPGRSLADHLPHGMLRTLRKARNRLDADDRKAEIVVTRRGDEVLGLLPDLERVYRARDAEHGLASDLDTAEGLAGWRARIRRLLDDRCLELATLTVDGELAAYVLGVVDGRWYRILDGRMDATFARYAPGRLLEAAVVDRALASGHHGVDWMTSVAPETLLAATTAEPVVTLTWRDRPADA